MVSRTLVKFRSNKKTNPSTMETIAIALKNKNWFKIAQIISASTKQYSSVNLDKIDKLTQNGDTVVIPGKVLSTGELTKKVRICALGFSALAIEKMKKTKSEAVSIAQEIKSNPKAEGVKIIK